MKTFADTSIAIIGMAGRFPDAWDLDEFWKNIEAGRESLSDFTDDELMASGVEPELLRNPDYVKKGTVLEGSDLFDAAFFGFTPREAEIMDPQHRVFLECAWHALEDAGYAGDEPPSRVGVYAGAAMNTYVFSNLLQNREILATVGGYQAMLGNDKDFLSTRVSYKLNLKGPSLTIQTACSTSLVAIQTACRALLACECDMALTGGVSLLFPQTAGYLHEEGMIFSSDGHCRPFDANATGTRAGQGSAVVVLKRLEDAIRDGDSIRALIRGAGVNNDGASKMGYTAPSVEGQSEAIMAAFQHAGVDPSTVSYVEAHGTATRVGDPIEIAALEQVFRAFTDKKQFCAIGSVKSNIGHLDAAAGVAGLVKTVLALQHRKIPASLGFETANPLLDLESSPFFVNAKLTPWDSPTPRRAGVSSFGIGGTNAHVILEEGRPQAESIAKWPASLLVLSTKSASALEAASQRLACFLRDQPDIPLADVCYTLQLGRKTFSHRRALVCSTTEEAIAALTTKSRPLYQPLRRSADRSSVTFMFSGQGSQYHGMGRGLYDSEPTFRRWIDFCSGRLQGSLGCNLQEQLYSPDADPEALNQTHLAQTALFCVEYSLARMWMSWGVPVDSMIGHSVGEYTAACVAGVFSLEDGLRLIEARGRIMQALPAGSMLAVPLPHDQLRNLLTDNLSVAAVNTDSLCTVSGPLIEIQRLQSRLLMTGVECRLLHTSHAFHSKMMDNAVDPFLEIVRSVKLSPPRIPFVSNVTGDWITADSAIDPLYWANHLRQTVRFADGIRKLGSEPGRLFLEVGPGQALCAFARDSTRNLNKCESFASMPHAKDSRPDLVFVLDTVARLWESGIPIRWAVIHEGETLHRVSLPLYPFERQRYYVQPQLDSAVPPVHSERPVKKDIDNWFYVPSWTRSVPPQAVPGTGNPGPWLIFNDANGLGNAIADSLQSRGAIAISVEPSERFEGRGDRSFGVNPSRSGDYTELLKILKESGVWPRTVVFLWGMPESLPDGGRSAFHCMLMLARALGEIPVSGPLDWIVVSAAMHDVTGGEAVDPEQALLLGPVKVIPSEYPDIVCRSIDLSHPAPTRAEMAGIVNSLILEPHRPAGPQVVAYRNAHRWEQTYLPISLPAGHAGLLRQRGVYLITGGTGGIGLTLAGYLAENHHARLALTCRTSLPPRNEWQQWIDSRGETDRISAILLSIQRMESHGAEVLLLSADVADESSMAHAIQEVRARFGKIHGVVHAAGIAVGGLIQLKTRESAEAVLSPKVDGAVILNSFFQGDPLDFFILCSSVNAISSGAGAVDYCAANAFLDAFATAQHRRTHGLVSSLNWAAWQGVGMAANTEVPRDLAESWKTHLAYGIEPAEGVEAFLRVLNAGLPQVAIVTRDLKALLIQPENQVQSRLQGSVRPAEPKRKVDGGTGKAGQAVETVRMEVRSDTEESIVRIWGELLGVDEIDLDDNFFRLGGHSLLATRVLSRVRNLFGLSVPLQIIFDAPTVRSFAEHVDTLLWATAAPAPDESGLREEVEF